MAAEKMPVEMKKCVTHQFRVSFPAVLKPKAFEDQAAKYSLVMLFPKKVKLDSAPKGQKVSMVKAAQNAAIEKWGPKEKWPKTLRMPFRDGDEKSDTVGYEDTIFVSASAKNRPGLVDSQLNPIINEEDFYAGCYARAELIAFAYDTKGNKGVSFALQNVQKLKDGEQFSGRRDPSTVFDAVEDDTEEDSSEEDTDESSDEEDTEYEEPVKTKKKKVNNYGF